MKLKEGSKLNLVYGVCQRQKGLDCALHAIAIAVDFASGNDPGKSRLSPSQMRPHLEEWYENEEITPFPGPQGNERPRLVGTGDETEIVIPALWHKPATAKTAMKAPKKRPKN